jgi:hypothetical protein
VSERRRAQAELARLARLLGREPDTLSYLEPIPPRDLERLREQVTEVLFAPTSGGLGRLAAASRVLPVALVATLGERVFGAVLSARIAGLLDPDRGAQVAARLPTAFLADVAAQLDPRRAEDLLARIPPTQIAQITAQLAARGEHLTMAAFVEHLGEEAIQAAAAEMDGATLLRVGAALERPQTLRRLVGTIGEEKLGEAIDAAAAQRLWPQALELLDGLDRARRARLIELAAQRSDEVLDGLIEAAQEQDLWDLLLPLTAQMSPATLARFARLRSLRQPATLERIGDLAGARAELAVALIPMLALLPAESQAVLAARISAAGAGAAAQGTRRSRGRA